MPSRVMMTVIDNREYIESDFAWSLAAIITENWRNKPNSDLLEVSRVSGQTISQMRNRAVEQARQTSATHLLMLDADMSYPPDIVARLLAHGKMVVGGIYPSRRPPWYLNVHIADRTEESDLGDYSSHRMYNMPYLGLIEVDVMGLGGAMFEMEVFRKLDRPYFNNIYHEDEKGEPGIVGDEFWFAKNCRDKGITIYCDTNTRYVHHCHQGVVFDPNRGTKTVVPLQ